MGRRRTTPETDTSRKQNISVSIPRYMADELSRHTNASAVVAKLLEENWSRISTMTIEDQIEAERQQIVGILKANLEIAVLDVFNRIRAQRMENSHDTRH